MIEERIESLAKGYQAVLEFIDEMEQLTQFQDKIDITSNINRIWDVFLENIRNLIRVDVCALFIVDEDTHEFVLKNVSPGDHAPICQQEIELQIECGTFSWVVNRRKPAIIPPMAFGKNKTVIMLPLTTIKRTLGVVLALTSIDENFITQENLRLLAMLTKQYSLVMENTLLYDSLKREHESLKEANEEIRVLSITDPLTKAYNRGYLMERFPQEIKRAKRYGRHLSVILSDIDHFKQINDTYGHHVGDQVLKQFVRFVLGLIRSDVDWLARYGGEEFLIVLPETDVQGAVFQAERLRTDFSQSPLRISGNEINITVSFGVTGFGPDTPDNVILPEALINTADKYLYQAKRQGRNMVIGGDYPVS